MATAYKIKYAASATPIETLTAEDGTTKTSLVHSLIDKTIGGGAEADCGSAAANITYVDYTTTASNSTTLTTALGGVNITGIDFIMIKIREAGSTGTPDVILRLVDAAAAQQTLSGVGDVIMLRPAGWASDNYKIYSSGATELAKIDILYGKVA